MPDNNTGDFDGDIVLLTDNRILVEKLRVTPAIMCAQRKAPKKVPQEEDFVRSNIDSFGNEIGQTTNWITSMFEVRAGFAQGTNEYEALSYRIKCGQTFQQNCIDKAKGIISKPMPRYWHDWHAASKIDDPDERALCKRIVAEKKPYFMRYIYPPLMKQYNTYIKNTNRNALREFDLTVPELSALPYNQLTERQKEFLSSYDRHMPVGVNDCIMNKICRIFENEFDGCLTREDAETKFDYRILRSDSDYSPAQYYEVERLYKEYNQRVRSFAVTSNYERIDEYDTSAAYAAMNDDFVKRCAMICPDKSALCNIIIDICYKKGATKLFAWNMCGEDIIRNLLIKNNNQISFPTLDEDGPINYCGQHFRVDTIEMEADE